MKVHRVIRPKSIVAKRLIGKIAFLKLFRTSWYGDVPTRTSLAKR